MKALITGASSGLGRDLARLLAARGYDLILVARRRDRLEQLQEELHCQVEIVCLDLAKKSNCFALYEQVKHEPIHILINNAGFGLFGAFDRTNLDTELAMIHTNIRAVHILTKLFLQDFIRRDAGYILNVSSSAAFQPGPLMACYYASKAYVLRLTLAIREELRHRHSRVYIGALCPGPFDTEFNERAHVQFAIPGLKSKEVAAYALQQMFRRKGVIIPGTLMKVSKFSTRLAPDAIITRIAYHIQRRKKG
ncbi:SDR family NAD(P)-dependent oxidoreductase [Zongyangia hominis]|uniref:SDR family oxidoreductase n=1 Tax=Zongyangia hominis TaxID=2763677 RepID=A0A926ECA3_9FIRM|nr:SDR family oxidoreductase [Zongyangia hominis]MBC8569496.1 SDR family oxidoreductase [Zongyangia hominis]